MSDARTPGIRGKKSRDDLAHLSGVERGLYRVFEFFSSIRLAVIVLPWLILECIAGAMIEAKVNTGAARYFVYGSWHFLACLAALAINIFCAAVSRFPWKRYQTGFVITHIGLLVLLFGSFLTLRHKLDSLMVAANFEKEEKQSQKKYEESRWANKIVDPTKEVIEVADLDPNFNVELEDYPVKNVQRVAVDLGPFDWGHQLFGVIPWRNGYEEAHRLPNGDELRIKKFHANCVREETYVPSEDGVSGVPALKTTLAFNDQPLFSRWIPLGVQAKNIDLQFGILSASRAKTEEHYAHFLHARPKTAETEQDGGGGLLGWLILADGEKRHRFRVDDLRRGKLVPVPGTKDFVEVVEYFPDARIGAKEGTLVAGGDDPNNPGLHLKIVRDGKTLDAFVLADAFKNRGISGKQPAPYRLTYRTADAVDSSGPSLAVSIGDKHSTFTLGELQNGPVSIEGGDLRIELIEYLPSARVAPDGSGLVNEEGGSDNPAMRLAIQRTGRPRTEVLCFADRMLDGMLDERRDVRMTMFTPPRRPLIELVASPGGRIAFRTWNSTTLLGSGELETGVAVPSWSIPQRNANVMLSADGFVASGRPDVKLIAKPLEPRENGERGAVVELRTPEGRATVNLYRNPEAFDDAGAWIKLQIKDRLLKVRLTSEELELPFKIRLDDFIEPKIPGTNQAAMFTSIVTLKDEKQKIEKPFVITMNRPLRHTAATEEGEVGGVLRSILDPLVPQSYSLYQTSISQTAKGPMSTYTVSRDPGIIIKYLGFLTSTLGIFLMFYMGGYFRSGKAKAAAGSAEGDDE